MESLIESTQAVFGAKQIFGLIEIAAIIGIAFALNKLASKHYADKTALKTRFQIVQTILILVSLILIILIAPIGDSRRGQLLSLVGIVLSAAVALSSTTVLGNAMAGLMLRSIRAFKPGDYIVVGDHSGRVTEMDLLHSEIQTEDSDLMTFSNIYLVSNPFKVIRAQEGTIVGVNIGLGYDVPHSRVEELLIPAIKDAGLEEPFVQILELGDFSVSYRAAGLLRPAKKIISTRSLLRSRALDALHAGGVEIVSPSFMNQRAIGDTVFIPKVSPRVKQTEQSSPDDVVFAKADEAESLESMKDRQKALQAKISELNDQLKAATDDAEKQKLTGEIETTSKKAEKLAELVDKNQEKLITPS